MPLNEPGPVVVAGDVMLDRYWSGTTGRISPEAPVPVVRVEDMTERPGGAANVALNLAALDAHVALVGLAGTDEFGDRLARAIADAGIDCHLHRDGRLATTAKLRVLARHQQLMRLDFEAAQEAVGTAPLVSLVRAALDGAAALVLSDYGKGALSDPAALIALGRGRGLPVLVDPKGRDFARYRGATVLTPNRAEFESACGPCADDAALGDRARALAQELGLEAVLVTLSEQGMLLVPAAGDAVHLPARAREVFDVTGAGDTVIATLAAALAAGHGLVRAAELANLAAGIVVGKLGAATVTRQELAAAERPAAGEGPRGAVDETGLHEALAAARTRGERIVMTNGCFDLLHAGHVASLEQARALGDRLVVAVNDDASVERLKGRGRPLIPLAERMAVLAGLAAVDWVVAFAEDTPAELIARVLPDVLAKGGDYRPEEVAGAPVVHAAGGEVVILDFVAGHSTSDLVRRIRESET